MISKIVKWQLSWSRSSTVMMHLVRPVRTSISCKQPCSAKKDKNNTFPKSWRSEKMWQPTGRQLSHYSMPKWKQILNYWTSWKGSILLMTIEILLKSLERIMYWSIFWKETKFNDNCISLFYSIRLRNRKFEIIWNRQTIISPLAPFALKYWFSLFS